SQSIEGDHWIASFVIDASVLGLNRFDSTVSDLRFDLVDRRRSSPFESSGLSYSYRWREPNPVYWPRLTFHDSTGVYQRRQSLGELGTGLLGLSVELANTSDEAGEVEVWGS